MNDVQLPPAVHVGFEDSVASLWRARAHQHVRDSYAGVPISKFPEDLRVYEHLLWLASPEVVIELGSQFGGSALWFRDRLRVLAAYGRVRAPRVIAIDNEIDRARETLEREHPAAMDGIVLVAGDVRDPELPGRIAEMVGAGTSCMVVEDSAHVYETTYAALEGFSSFVPPGGFFVVEDGCVDIEEMRMDVDWPRGVLPALQDWLGSDIGKDFEARPDLELYGITCHPGGFLQRRMA